MSHRKGDKGYVDTGSRDHLLSTVRYTAAGRNTSSIAVYCISAMQPTQWCTDRASAAVTKLNCSTHCRRIIYCISHTYNFLLPHCTQRTSAHTGV